MTAPRIPRSTTRRGVQPAVVGATPDQVSVLHASRAYRELVHALADSVVEYHAMRHGVEMVSRVNYSLQKRVQRQRARA